MACNGRCLLIVLCLLQLITTIERQVFDFLGYMWAPVIANFLALLFCIIGFFGACQYQHRVVVPYAIWCLIWIGWNAFIICFYLEVGILKLTDPYLNIGTGGCSWWINQGIGCKVEMVLNSTSSSANLTVCTPVATGCILPFYYVEVIHAGVQCILAIFGFFLACFTIYIFTEEDDSSQPVIDELEYIKMRYRSPARQSFRTNRTYDNLNGSRTDTVDRTLRSHRDVSAKLADMQTKIAEPLCKDELKGDSDDADTIIGQTQIPTPLTPLKTSSDFDGSFSDSHECSTLPTRVA